MRLDHALSVSECVRAMTSSIERSQLGLFPSSSSPFILCLCLLFLCVLEITRKVVDAAGKFKWPELSKNVRHGPVPFFFPFCYFFGVLVRILPRHLGASFTTSYPSCCCCNGATILLVKFVLTKVVGNTFYVRFLSVKCPFSLVLRKLSTTIVAIITREFVGCGLIV